MIKIKTCQLPKPINKSLHVCSLNARSIKNKSVSVADFIISNDLDIIALTETWLGSDIDNIILSKLVPSGYDIKHVPRSGSRGGGVAIIFKLGIKIKMVKLNSVCYSHFESMSCAVHVNNVAFQLHVVYRPPPSSINDHTNSKFFEEWPDFLEAISNYNGELIVTGDLNFHFDNETNNDTIHMMTLFEHHGLKQHVKQATHKKGHILDVLITRETQNILTGMPLVLDPCLVNDKGVLSGDHYAILFHINATKPMNVVKNVCFRRLRSINVSDFKKDITDNILLNETSCINTLNSELGVILDKHAPIINKKVILRPNAPWYTNDIRVEKRHRRKLERIYRKTGLMIHKQSYDQQCVSVNKMCLKASEEYYLSKIRECNGDPRKIKHIMAHLLGNKKTPIFPSAPSDQILANDFINFFTNKISKIRNNIESGRLATASPIEYDNQFCGTLLNHFTSCTPEQICKYIHMAPNKSCELDPVPTWLLKEIAEKMSVPLCNIINKSFELSEIPSSLKQAHIRPLIKKPGLNAEDMANYRPVSNLPFVSKLMEKIVASQLEEHLTRNDLLDPFQSAYKQYHSTETALLLIQNDIAESLKAGSATALVLLDLSAAFDTIDHDILLSRLNFSYGLNGSALSWFKAYLKERHQCVVIRENVSDECSLSFGVPQGSVLGPILYCMYTKPVSDIIKMHNLSHTCYADDTQMYVTIKSINDWDKTSDRIKACTQEIKSWMKQNYLQLNESKTEFIVFEPKNSKVSFSDLNVEVGESKIQQSMTVKNLGCVFNRHLTKEHHVNTVVRACFAELRKINSIRKSIDIDACKTLIQYNVISRLDYCNSLLYGIPQYLSNRLQRVQNYAARLIFRRSKFDHITPILFELHWIPVKYRSKYKILLLTYKCLNGLAPKYLVNLLTVYQPARSLRSESDNLLVVPRVNQSFYLNKSFSYTSADLWNKLPLHLKSLPLDAFKKELKTHIFKEAYNLL